MSLYESVESYSPLIEKSNLVEWGFWVSAGQRFSFLESAKRKDKNETFKIKKMEIYGQVKKKKDTKLFSKPQHPRTSGRRKLQENCFTQFPIDILQQENIGGN